MNDLLAIKLRTSRRAYTGPLTNMEANVLGNLVDEINERSGLRISLQSDAVTAAGLFGGFRSNYGMFSGVQGLFVIAGSAEDPHLLEKAGYWGEKLVLEATKMGLGTCWVGGTFDKKTVNMTLKDGERLVAVITVGHTRETKTSKERIIYKATHRKNKSIGDFYTSDISPLPGWFLAGMQAVLRAPSAMNGQPVRFVYEKGRALAKIPDNAADYQRIDLGIAKLHFSIAAQGHFLPGNNAEFVLEIE